MHAFLSLAQAMALVLGQAEPADAPPPAPVEEAAPAPSAAEPPAVEGADRPRVERRRLRPAAPATPAPDAAAAQQAAAPPPQPAEAERAQVARVALAFLDALVAGDAAAVAAASADRFSFDGDVRSGKDEVRRAWRALLADRDPGQRGALLDLELLPAADAVARLGPPPPRLASLAAARGGWVAVANVSRRPVVLFLAREGRRFAVTGLE